MRVLCLCKKVFDYQSRLSVQGTQVLPENGKYIINPFDEIAVEEAVRLKEAGLVSEIVALSVGIDEQPIRYALSMGCDRGVLIRSDEYSDPQVVSKLIVDYVSKNDFKLLLCGKQAIDTDSGQIPGRVAGILSWRLLSYASKIQLQPDCVVVEKEVDKGIEVIKAPLPAVITVDLRLNTPRLPPLPAVLKAKSKPLDVIQPEISYESQLFVLHHDIPKRERKKQVVKTVDEFYSILKEVLPR